MKRDILRHDPHPLAPEDLRRFASQCDFRERQAWTEAGEAARDGLTGRALHYNAGRALIFRAGRDLFEHLVICEGLDSERCAQLMLSAALITCTDTPKEVETDQNEAGWISGQATAWQDLAFMFRRIGAANAMSGR